MQHPAAHLSSSDTAGRSVVGTKGEFDAVQGNGPVPGVLLTRLERFSYSGSWASADKSFAATVGVFCLAPQAREGGHCQ